MLELKHRVSKGGAEDFWTLVTSALPRVYRARLDQNVYKDMPQFSHIRRKLYKKNTPKVNLKIAYKNKETDEITVVESDKTPVSAFPASQYQKLYEVATVEVKIIYELSMASTSHLPRQARPDNIPKHIKILNLKYLI